MTNAPNVSLLSSDKDIIQLSNTKSLSSLDSKTPGVYAILDSKNIPQYVGYARNVQTVLIQQFASNEEDCAMVILQYVPKATRAGLTELQDRWISDFQQNEGLEDVPLGNRTPKNQWTHPNLSIEEARKKLGMFSETTTPDSPNKQSTTNLPPPSSSPPKPEWQNATLEMYTAPNCPHCERMRQTLRSMNVSFSEIDIENETPSNDEIQRRRIRHAKFNTVPQLYVLREPPLNGLEAEWLVGGADDLEKLLEIPENSGFSFLKRIGKVEF